MKLFSAMIYLAVSFNLALAVLDALPIVPRILEDRAICDYCSNSVSLPLIVPQHQRTTLNMHYDRTTLTLEHVN